jgi:cytochrome d ubiquinol oxidase subunit II
MAYFWAAALALSLLLYVLLDGFDLGVGMLFATAPGEQARRHMLDAISPVWDGNETWLIIAAATLFGAFPSVYSILLGAFYVPLVAMLAGLILRGVAFEYRYKTERLRWVWDTGFVVGSFAASFTQGMTVGALAQELPVQNGRYVGTLFSWLSPISVLCGFGLCLGYMMLGAGWLVHKTAGDTRDHGYRALPSLLAGVLLFLVAAFITTLALDLRVMRRWLERPELFVFLLAGAAACAGMVRGIRRRHDPLPFWMGVVIFLAAFATLAGSFLPYMVPFSLTITEAAAPPSTLAFLFWGAGIFVLPVTLAYTVVVYTIFKGKVVPSS